MVEPFGVGIVLKWTEVDINRQLEKLQTFLNGKNLDIKINIDDSQFKNLFANLQNLNTNLNKALNIDPNTNGLDKLSKKYNIFTDEFGNEFENINKVTKEFTNNLSQNVKEIQTYRQEVDKFGNTMTVPNNKTREYTDSFKKQREEIDKLANAMGNLREKSEVRISKDDNKWDLNQSKAINKTLDNKYKEDLKAQQQIENALLETERKRRIENEKFEQTQSKVQNKIADEQYKSSQNNAYSQQEQSLKNIYTLSKQKIDAEKNGYIELTAKLQEQIKLEGQKYNLARRTIRENKLTDLSKDAELLKIKNDLQIDLNNKKVKELDISQQDTKEIEKQIALEKVKLEIKIKNAQTTYGKHFTSDMSKSVFDKSDLINVNNYKDAIKNTNLELDKVTAKAKEARKEHTYAMKEADNFMTTLSKDFGKMVAWTLVGGSLFGSLRQITTGISYIYDLDNALNEIRIVTNKTQTEVNGLADSYNKLAREMSVTTKEITATAADLYRQGLGDSEVETRMKGIIQYAKISSISLEESNQIITATANATGESVNKIIDIFALLGDTTASGADEIGEALQRVASASENSNLSLEKSASWLATISSITRESSSTIGRSLNSLISRYESIKTKGFNEEDVTKINDVTKALSAIGINPTVNGQLRDISEVMDELGTNADGLGSKWDKLSKNEKSYISTVMFGTYQRNRGITLLNNYQDSLKNYENALNSAGVAEQKFTIYQESTAAKMDQLKASLEGFWQSTLDSSAIKSALTILTYLIDTLGNLPVILGAIAMGLALWKGTQITTWLNKTTDASNGFRVSIIKTKGELIGLTKAEIASAAATRGLALSWNALKIAFKSNPFGFIITTALTLITVFDLLKPVILGIKDENEKLIETQKKQIESNQTEANSHKTLVDQYDKDIQKANELIAKRNDLAKNMESLSDTDKKKIDLNVDLINSEQELGDIIGQEALDRLKAAGFTQDACNTVVKALQERQNAEKTAYENSMKLVAQQTENLRKNIIAQIEQVGKAVEAYGVLGTLQEGYLAWQIKAAEKNLNDDQWIANNSWLFPGNKIQQALEKDQQVLNDLYNQREEFYANQKSDKIGKLLEQLNSLGGNSGEPTKIPDITVGGGDNLGGGSDKKKAEEPGYQDPTDAFIRAKNAIAETTQSNIKYYQSQLKIAEANKDTAKQLEINNTIYSQQVKEIAELQEANAQFKLKMDEIKHVGFGAENWIDLNGESTENFVNLYNNSSKEVQESMQKQFDQISKLTKAMRENESQIDALSSAQQDLAKSITETRNEMADQIIQAIKSAYEMQKDIAIKTLQDEMDAEDRRHQRKMNNLDAELQKLQRTKETEDYGKNLSKAQQEALEIQKQIDVLALDNSIEAKAKREELAKSLAEKKEEIANLENDREYELREQNIEDQKTAEDKKYETTKNRIDDEIEAEEYKFDQLINDEVKYAKMREDIIEGNVDNIKTKLQEFLTAFAQMNAETAAQIGLSWSALTQTINSVETATGTATKASKPTVYVRSGSKDGAILDAQYGNQIKIVEDDSKVDSSLIGADRYATNAKYQEYLKKYGLTATDVGDLWKFEDGGLTETTGWHWIDGKKGKPEGILSSEQTTSWTKLVDNLTSLVPITDVLKKLVNLNPLQNIMSSYQPLDLSKIKLEFAGGSPITVNNTVNFENHSTTPLTNKEMDRIVNYMNTKTINGLKKRGKA